MGADAPDAGRRGRAGPVGAAVRPPAADAAADGAGRGDRAVRPGRARRPGHGPGGRGDRRADGRLDAHAGPAGGRGRRARRHPRLLPALPARRPGADRELRAPGRGRRLRRDRRHARHADPGLAAARPDAGQLPAAARAVPGQLLHRPGVPGEAGRAARGRPAGGHRAVGVAVRHPGADLGRPGLAAVADPAAAAAQGHLRAGGRPPGRRCRGRRDLLLQPRRPAGERWAAGARLPARGGGGGRRRPGLVRLRRPRRRARGQGARPRRDRGRRSAGRTRTGWRWAGRPASSTCCAACWRRPT